MALLLRPPPPSSAKWTLFESVWPRSGRRSGVRSGCGLGGKGQTQILRRGAMARRADVQYDLNNLYKGFSTSLALNDLDFAQLAAHHYHTLLLEAADYDAALRRQSRVQWMRLDLIRPSQSMWMHLWTAGSDMGLMHFMRVPRAVMLVSILLALACDARRVRASCSSAASGVASHPPFTSHAPSKPHRS